MLQIPDVEPTSAALGRSGRGQGASDLALVFSCEHGGNKIPAEYQFLFAEHLSLLETHRGYDLGALLMARDLASAFGAPLVEASVSRLLVDLNRSEHHPGLHLQAVRQAPVAVRQDLLRRHYYPYRQQLERAVMRGIANRRQVLHVSVHSFTPELSGKVRNADVGLLYDPARPGEVAFCRAWKRGFALCAPELRVRRNYPYEGRNDGLTRYFRQRLSADIYVGMELELNQAFAIGPEESWQRLRTAVIDSLQLCLGGANNSLPTKTDPCDLRTVLPLDRSLT